MSEQKSSGWIVWIVLLILVGGGGYWGYNYYSKHPKEPPIEYRTATISRGDITQQVTANGQITPVKSVAVGTQVSGIIKELMVDFNSRVTNNQIIARIDPSTYEQSITQAEADLANAKAALDYAILSMKRADRLKETNLITPDDYDKAVLALHQAEATTKVREAALKKANVDLERTTIYAPIDGIVISRSVDVGQTVAASFNTPTLFTIANDLARMEIDAMVSEADVGGVEETQDVKFTVDAFPNKIFRGKVRQVRYAAITNQNVVNYTTVVDVDNPDLKLRPGMTANASIITSQKKSVLRIPNGALRFRPPESAVVLKDGTKDAPGGTNRPPSIASNSDASSNDSGGGGGPRSEEMRKRFENASPEEREKMKERFRSHGGGGGGGGGNGGGNFSRSREDQAPTRTVYLLEKESGGEKESQVLKPVTVKVGINDGTQTEVVEGIKEGDVVVVGVVTSATAAKPPTGASPFGGPFGGGMRPPGR